MVLGHTTCSHLHLSPFSPSSVRPVTSMLDPLCHNAPLPPRLQPCPPSPPLPPSMPMSLFFSSSWTSSLLRPSAGAEEEAGDGVLAAEADGESAAAVPEVPARPG